MLLSTDMLMSQAKTSLTGCIKIYSMYCTSQVKVLSLPETIKEKSTVSSEGPLSKGPSSLLTPDEEPCRSKRRFFLYRFR